MSDLHLEWRGYEDFKIPRKAPNLLLVGDIGRLNDYTPFLSFLRRQCETFDRVMLVPGNHEFYGSSREEGLSVGLEFERELGSRFTLMDKRRVVLDYGKTVVLGCTLHSHIPEDYTRLTKDFQRIRDWTVKHHNDEHATDLNWLKDSLAEESTYGNCVIVATHYAPSFRKTVRPEQEGNDLSRCFCSDTLSKLKNWAGANLISEWVFGHTHYNTRFKWDNLTVISNQPPGPMDKECSGRSFDVNCVI